jgi:hypothetical protein
LRNYKLWKEDCLDPTLELATGFDAHGEALAILECTEFQKLSSMNQLNKHWQRVMGSYITLEILNEYPIQSPPPIIRNGVPPARRTTSLAHSRNVQKLGKSKKLSQFFFRLAMALFGGLALIALMLIMSLH